MPVSTSKLSSKDNTKGKDVEVDVFHITDIPDAMRNMGWYVAPQLMEHWFSIKPSFVFNSDSKMKILNCDARNLTPSQYNKDIVKMDWAIKYHQVKDGIDFLMKNWNSEKGRDQLKARLRMHGWDGKNNVFLRRSEDVLEIDATSQVNIRTIGSLLDTIDDWYGAIGNATLKLAVSGFTTTFDNEPYFIVEKIGFYLKDTYDFLSDSKWTKFGLSEPLGIWSKSGTLDKAKASIYISSYTQGLFGLLAREFSGYVPVNNDDFREWQEKHNSGGDYIVFSDIIWMEPLNKDKSVRL